MLDGDRQKFGAQAAAFVPVSRHLSAAADGVQCKGKRVWMSEISSQAERFPSLSEGLPWVAEGDQGPSEVGQNCNPLVLCVGKAEVDVPLRVEQAQCSFVMASRPRPAPHVHTARANEPMSEEFCNVIAFGDRQQVLRNLERCAMPAGVHVKEGLPVEGWD